MGDGGYHVTVEARRFATDEPNTFSQEIIGDEARYLPMIDDDLYRSVHLVPGVQATDYTARFGLRGGEMDEIQVLLDGVPLFEPFHLQDYGGSISALDLGLMKLATLYGDGFPATFGDTMGGVFNVVTRDPGLEHHAAAGFDLLNAHVMGSGPLGDGGYLVALRRGYLDLFISAWAEHVDFRPSYWDLFTKVEHPLPDGSDLALHLLLSGDHNELHRAAPDPDLFSDYFNGQTWLTWRKRLPGGIETSAAASYARGTRDRDEERWGWDLRTVDRFLLQQDWIVPEALAGATIKWGGRLRWSRGDYDYYLTGLYDLTAGEKRDVDVDTEVQAMDASLYLQLEYQPVSWSRLVLGLRGLKVQGVEELGLDPRVSLALMPTDHLTLRVAWGLYSQPVLPYALPVEAGVRDLVPMEWAEHRVVGVRYRPGPWLDTRIEAYKRTYHDLVGFVPNLGRQMRTTTMADQAEAEGVEVEARGYLWGGRVGWLVGYALSRATEWAGAGEEYPRAWDRTHALTAGLDLDAGWLGRVDLAYRYHSGLPYTPVVGLIPGLPGQDPDFLFGPPGSERMPPFHSLDARLTHRWGFDGWHMDGYIQVVNATLRTNVEEVVYEIEQGDEGPAVVSHEEHYFPLLPTLGLNVVF